MFRSLGKFVVRYWYALLAIWIGAAIALTSMAPVWRDVIQGGEFAFLPEDVPSRLGENLAAEAFPNEMLASSIVVVVRRESRPEGLQEADLEFIETELKPRIERIAEEEGGLAIAPENDQTSAAKKDQESVASASLAIKPDPDGLSVISQVRTEKDKEIGHLLRSEDQKASLVLVELTTEFLANRNMPTIKKVEELVGKNGELDREGIVPPGLDISLSGSAVVGRDMIRAAADSARATELWTVLLVVFLLVAIYRAPLLALIPLITVFLSVKVSLAILAILAKFGVVGLFAGIEIYVTVLLYGAGVDYCLFLIARFKEELDERASLNEAIENSLWKVGDAISASAFTVICGIGMMVFAEFGKFQQAGIAISMSLVIVLLAALTFTPTLLRMVGYWAFWPQVKTERLKATAGWISSTSLMKRLLERNWHKAGWERVAQALVKRPGTIWIVSLMLMIPFAVVGTMFFRNLSYGLLSELPATDPSVVGTKAVQQHFPAGATGPATMLLRNTDVEFPSLEGINSVKELTSRLNESKAELNLADVRSLSHPFGGSEDLSTIGNLFQRKVIRDRAVAYYVGGQGEHEGNVTRIDVVFKDDPFSRGSIANLNRLQQRVTQLLPESLQDKTELFFLGPTANIRDLKTVTDGDQVRIDILVLAGVFLILVLLLRQPAISLYLIITVSFSFIVTLGVTFTFFWALDPTGFTGLDWKVPMFLFTILIAVGEDYNIFLMTRIDEEQRRHGQVGGVVVALQKTGSIISSCGIIMAGTFSSLLAGTLVGMQQLGFALAFGVLLDTFVIRPILVPAYLILLHSGRFGSLGALLGAREDEFSESVPLMTDASGEEQGPSNPQTVADAVE